MLERARIKRKKNWTSASQNSLERLVEADGGGAVEDDVDILGQDILIFSAQIQLRLCEVAVHSDDLLREARLLLLKSFKELKTRGQQSCSSVKAQCLAGFAEMGTNLGDQTPPGGSAIFQPRGRTAPRRGIQPISSRINTVISAAPVNEALLQPSTSLSLIALTMRQTGFTISAPRVRKTTLVQPDRERRTFPQLGFHFQLLRAVTTTFQNLNVLDALTHCTKRFVCARAPTRGNQSNATDILAAQVSE